MAIKKSIYNLFFLALIATTYTFSSHLAFAQDENNIALDSSALANSDHDLIRELITNQLAAIKKRDAEAAFSTLSESMHGKFNDSKKFLAKMRFEYGPIYNHEAYTFLESHGTNDGDIIQKVRVQDRYSGEKSLVIYRISIDLEGHYVIDSFTIINFDSTPI